MAQAEAPFEAHASASPSPTSRGPSLHEALDAQAASGGDRVFLFDGGTTATFGEVAAASRSLAAALGHLGVEPGDRVALLLPACAEFVQSLFALSRLGAVAVPLDPRLPPSELRYLLRHSEAVAVVTIERFLGVDYLQRFEDLLPALPELQYLVTVGEEDLWYDDRIFQFEDLLSAGRGKSLPPAAGSGGPEGVAVLLYGSGPAGKPRGVELSHQSLLGVAAAVAEVVGLTPSDRVIGVSALHHVFPLGPGILGCVHAGASLILQREADPDDALDLAAGLSATVHYGVPTLYAAELRAQEARPRDLSSLRRGVVAGAPMLEELRKRVEANLCPDLLTAYSLTETASVLAMTRPDDPEEKRRFTVGRPLPGTRVRVLERDGTELPVESLGEIAVAGPGLLRGYYRQPRATDRVLGEDGFLRTGDLGILDDDGYVHLVGRRQDVILRGGSNVHPGEIESRLAQHPAVQAVAVVGIRDELLGEAISAAVVQVEGAIVTEEELRDWCGETLAEGRVPDFVRFLEALPTSSSGKVRRVELVRLLEAHA